MDEEKREFSFRVSQMWDESLGLGSSHSILGFFLLLIAVLLPGIHCALGSVYYSSYEIVIPRRLTTKEGEEGTGKTSYSIFMRGKRQVIHLKQKRGLFAKNLPVYTYNNGKLGLAMPLLPKDCYYDGYVESDLGSLVSLSTCSGLKGIITIEKMVYDIEPIDASSKFEHVLYERKKGTLDTCKGPKRQPLQFSGPLKGKQYEYHDDIAEDDVEKEYPRTKPLHYIWSHTKYVEMFVVVDNNRFQKWDHNVTKTSQMVMEVISLVNTYTYEINIKVVLIGLEIWMQRNPINIPVQMREALPVFNDWRAQTLFKRVYHDVAHLIVGHHPGNVVGDAYFRGACVAKDCAAVESFYHEDVTRFATLMAHELGHNLGMLHEQRGCLCGAEKFCIMHEFVTQEMYYSNCSKDNLYEFLRVHRGSCLYNKPEAKKIMRLSICGNQVLDRGEECDCGSEETCARDPCCLPTCKMVGGATCAFGPCCQGCQFQLRGRVCRPSRDECDLPEYCNGTSMWCQRDVYKQNGTPCRGHGYCYEGRCRGLDLQCVEIFGEGSKAARESCYRFMNQKGDRFGNCGSLIRGKLHKVFVGCHEKDIKCGKVMCENVQRLPQMRNHHTFIQVLQGDTWCWGADLFEGLESGDRGEVPSGTMCGPSQVCINKGCYDTTVLHLACNPYTKCHRRGVCNNLSHCHCNSGYAPPTCKARGEGGSVDSGPPPKTYTTSPPTTTTATHQTNTIPGNTTTPQNTITTITPQSTITTITPQSTITTIMPQSTTIPPPVSTSSSQNEKNAWEKILDIFLFLTTLILLVNTVIWYFIILAYAQKSAVIQKKRKNKTHQ